MAIRRSFGFAALSLAVLTGGCSTGPLPSRSVTKASAAATTAEDPLVAAYRSRFQASASPAILAASTVKFFEDVPAGVVPRFQAQTVLKTAEVILPRRTGKPFGLVDRESGLSVNVELLDTTPVEADFSSGYAIYRRAHASGATLLQMPRLDGVEDYLPFDSRPAAEKVTYRVSLKGGVAGLRLFLNSLEFLDASGTPRLRMNPPSVVGGDGSVRPVEVRVDGCAFDSSPAGPWHRPTVRPGSDTCLVSLTWSVDSYPALLDPAWITAGANVYDRQGNAAIAPVGPTANPRALILAAGGIDSAKMPNLIASAELFDTVTRTWSLTSNMPTGVVQATATAFPALAGTSWNALVVGGNTVGNATVAATQEYDEPTGTWINCAQIPNNNQNINQGRYAHVAVYDNVKKQVIIAGGTQNCANGHCNVINTVYGYTPANQNWNLLAPMPNLRSQAIASLVMKDTRWLVVEGAFSQGTADIFDFGTQTWGVLNGAIPPVPPLPKAHGLNAAAAEMWDGRLLYTGGAATPNLAVIYDPNKNAWVAAAPMKSNRSQHTLSLGYIAGNTAKAVSQQMLAAGGDQPVGAQNTSEYYDPSTNLWTLGPQLPFPRYLSTAVATNNTTFLVAGTSMAATNENEIYTLALNSETPAPVLTQHYNNARTGVNLSESLLTPASVGGIFFGHMWTCQLDGNVEAQPLYVPALVMSDGKMHNVVFVVTNNNSIWALDADSSLGGANGTCTIWQTSLGDVVPVPNNGDLINAALPGAGRGISATPVIDLLPGGGGTIYLVAFVGWMQNGSGTSPLTTRVGADPPNVPGDPLIVGGTYQFQLYAVDLQSGLLKKPPVTIGGTAPGTAPDCKPNNNTCIFSPTAEFERAGLALAGQDVIVTFGGPGDRSPWHGWEFSYDKTTLQQTGTTLLQPDSDDGGAIWQGAAAPAVDSEGNIYVMTGNGDFSPALPNGGDWGDSLVKLGDAGINNHNPFVVLDSFTPTDQLTLRLNDLDLGSSGPVLWNGMVFAAGKEGMVYRTQQTKLGGYQKGPNNTDGVTEEGLVGSLFTTCQTSFPGMFVSQPVIWGKASIGDWIDYPEIAWFYDWPSGGNLQQYQLTAWCGINAPCGPANPGIITDYKFGTTNNPCAPPPVGKPGQCCQNALAGGGPSTCLDAPIEGGKDVLPACVAGAGGVQSPTLFLSSNGPLETAGKSNGTGILWAYEQDPANSNNWILRAYDATNVSVELWNSGSVAGKSKFHVPTVANGRVYVGTSIPDDDCNRLPGNPEANPAMVTLAFQNGLCSQNIPTQGRLLVYGLTCRATGEACSPYDGCCTGVCDYDATCELEPGQECNQPANCLSQLCDLDAGICECSPSGGLCGSDSDCCANQCDPDSKVCCNGPGTQCAVPADCCAGYQCTNQTCQ